MLKDKITKKELLDKLANLPDNAEILFSAWDYEKMENGRIRKYSLCIEKIDISISENYASIRLNGENYYKNEDIELNT